MRKYDIGDMPPQISAEVIALLEQAETAAKLGDISGATAMVLQA
jgi:hypothetical protein